MTDTADRQRIDKWLWFARLAKTRTLAQKLAVSGRVRVNTDRNDSASRLVKVGDTLTIAVDPPDVRILRILAMGHRRGPAPEARLLYEDLTPSRPASPLAAGPRAGRRPTKRERRALDAIRGGFGDDFPEDGV